MDPRFAESSKLKSYTDIVNSTQFQTLLRQKRRFIVPLTVFFFAFYFLLPIFTAYTTFLNHAAIGPISWAWVFAFAQFIMTWVLCIIYHKKAKQFDAMLDSIRDELKL
ncbi:DUF485 domain-containing protein [Paenibacillus sp. Soil787]|uniref:DUF485 domain-containing protein n=1 Tax=Paenibacillus sp. Soil787 TaxID=1736411 RepID=UPI0006FB9B37|nr:DUF485 domain-containing protein [Paenibacillus sp. Soil787]KRF43615.1 hypothetical protein ASG93_01450 [Paenibacillus sp. Soil787]